ncbi:MAG: hypothetical protein JWN30_2565, partial [Bacilli bacterium]|nr:hypothetical protein [Bacilli bacterium]
PVSTDQASAILSSKFKDASTIAPDLRLDVATAVYSGLMLGDNHNFRPDDGLTRGEAAILLTRLQDNMQAAPGTPVNVVPVTIIAPTKLTQEDYTPRAHGNKNLSN